MPCGTTSEVRYKCHMSKVETNKCGQSQRLTRYNSKHMFVWCTTADLNPNLELKLVSKQTVFLNTLIMKMLWEGNLILATVIMQIEYYMQENKIRMNLSPGTFNCCILLCYYLRIITLTITFQHIFTDINIRLYMVMTWRWLTQVKTHSQLRISPIP